MRPSTYSRVAAFASLALVNPLAKRAASPTVYLAGDSTMAEGGGGDGDTDGWGQYLQSSLSIPVINNAIGGRSARSFTVEGRFDAIASVLQPDDFVIIEFGHNDGGTLPADKDNGRTDCPGAGDEVCNTDLQQGILTYPAYIIDATEAFVAKGAQVVIASPTPNNPWETGAFVYEAGRFTDYAALAAEGFENAEFVDHGRYVADAFEALGEEAVDAFYPNDHTHTAPAGAEVVAQAFVRGLLCSQSVFKTYVVNATEDVIGSCA